MKKVLNINKTFANRAHDKLKVLFGGSSRDQWGKN